MGNVQNFVGKYVVGSQEYIEATAPAEHPPEPKEGEKKPNVLDGTGVPCMDATGRVTVVDKRSPSIEDPKTAAEVAKEVVVNAVNPVEGRH